MKKIILVLPLLLLTGCQAAQSIGTSLSELNLPHFDAGRDGRTTMIPQGNCPSVARVAELSSMYQFIHPKIPNNEELVGVAHLSRVTSTCGKTGKNLTLNLALDFGGVLGPRGRIRAGDKPSFTYPYFVAVTNSKNQILAKEIYALTLAYDADDTQLRQTETFTQMVPLDGDDPRSYRLLIGFQLAPDEVAYNRTLPDDQLGKDLDIITVVPTGR